nr:uncharacterized protein [uncultured bacterium]
MLKLQRFDLAVKFLFKCLDRLPKQPSNFSRRLFLLPFRKMENCFEHRSLPSANFLSEWILRLWASA